MFKFLSTIIFGVLEDNIPMFVLPQFLNILEQSYTSFVGYPFGRNLNVISNQPLLWIPYYFFSYKLNGVLVYNLYVILSVILAILVSFLFFNYFTKNRFISFISALVFMFNGFVLYHFRSHMDLSQLWSLLLFVFFLFKAKNYKDYLVLGLSWVLVLSLSSYLGYFAGIFLICFFVSKTILYKFNYFNKTTILGLFITIVPVVLFAMTFLKSYLLVNYTSSNLDSINHANLTNWKLFGNYDTYKSYNGMKFTNKGIENFFNFTSRPWYYFLPSIDNPFIGFISEKSLDLLQNKWGYFLTQNYFKAEHSASFLGYLTFFISILGFLEFKKKDEKSANLILLTSVLLFIFTMPPFFTISGLKIYMPSFILWKFFPMFRVLARLGVLINLLEFVFFGVGILYLFNLLSNKFKGNMSVLSYLTIFLIFFACISEFFVPIKMTDVSKAPAVFEYLKENTDRASVISVYPYDKSEEAFFWQSYFKRALINPKGYNSPEYGFYSEEFTDKLPTCQGLLEMINLGGNDVVFFFNSGAPNNEQALTFFNTTNLLIQVKSFEGTDSESKDLGFLNNFLILANTGNKRSNSAILYKVRDSLDLNKEISTCLSAIN